MQFFRTGLLLSLSMGLLAGCVALPATKGQAKPVHTTTATAVTGLIGLNGAALISQDGGGLISQDGGGLISQDGGGLISQDGGGLISQDGGGLSGSVAAPASVIGHDGAGVIGQAGAGAIGHDGASIIAQGGGNLVQAVANVAPRNASGAYHLNALAQAPLAGAHVYLATASGRLVTDAQGQLLTTVTDRTGHFRFPNLRARAGIAFFVPIAAPQGHLQALVGLVTKDHAATQPTVIDLPSTVIGTYVMGSFLKSRPAADRAVAFDRLQDSLAAAALADAARLVVATAPTGLTVLDIVRFVDGLRRTDKAFDSHIDDIRKVLTVAGQDTTVSGQSATKISLQQPLAVAADLAGNIYIAEGVGGVLRKISPDGTSSELIGPGSVSQHDQSFASLTSVVLGPDGNLYFTGPFANRVYRITPDGKTLTAVAGGGTANAATPGTRALDAALSFPRTLAFDAAGSLYVGESSNRIDVNGRLLKITTDGQIGVEAVPEGGHDRTQRAYGGLAVTDDGAIWALDSLHSELIRRPPGGSWTLVPQTISTGLAVKTTSGIVAHGNLVLVALGDDNVIVQAASDGTLTNFAGKPGGGSADGDVATAGFSQPSGLAVVPKTGEILVAETGNALVRGVLGGKVRTIAGTRGVSQTGDPLVVPLNLPGGLAVDPQGRIVVAELGSHTIKRIDGQNLVTLAGTTQGFSGDNGPATAAQFSGPVAIAFKGNDLYVADTQNRRIRKIDGNGTVTSFLGAGSKLLTGPNVTASESRLQQIGGLAVSPAGLLHFVDHGHIFRVEATGRITLVAGSYDLAAPDGDNQDATMVKLGFSSGLAFDLAGNLFIAETSTLRIRKVTTAGIISTVVGSGVGPTFAKIIAGNVAGELDVPATQASLVVPAAVVCDAAGNLYIAEAGTRGARDVASISAMGSLDSLPILDGRLRVLGLDGRVKTLAGLGAPAANGKVVQPSGIALDSQGRVVFADTGSGEVKILAK